MIITNSEKAVYKRRKFKNEVVSITGTCGKTTTLEMINTVLKYKYQCDKSPKNCNGFKGIPYSINEIFRLDSKVWLSEIGIDSENTMDKKVKILLPTIKILTNIGNAHTENFKTVNDYHLEKNL